MAVLNIEHDTIDEIPEAHRELYTERDGKFVLTGIGGIKTQADIDRIMGSLTKEKEEHKATKEKHRPWADLGIEVADVTAKLDRFTELEVAAAGDKDTMDAQLEKLTEARVLSRLAPVEREHKTLTAKYSDLLSENEEFKARDRNRTITDKIRVAAKLAEVSSDAMGDVEIVASLVFSIGDDGVPVTKENPYGFPAGLNADLFFQEARGGLRPLWWPKSVGGGAGGSGGGKGYSNNPWSKDSWNMTEQGAVVREHGMERANAMAKAAGTSVGKPAPV